MFASTTSKAWQEDVMRSVLLGGLFSWLMMACAYESTQTSEIFQDSLLAGMPVGALAAPGDFDGDQCTDIAAKGSNGIWYIDYCANGFGGAWDAAFPSYGDDTAIPVPADYDGDGITDLAVKDATGMWGIDYAANGFGVFDVVVYGYGDASSIPVPADYDGDGKADLSVKDSSGNWYIDYASDGFHGWNVEYQEYGNANALPVPADYDGDHKADLSVKTTTGDWYIDYSNDGFHGWNVHVTGYGGSSAVPVPADYDHDGKADLAVKDSTGTWYVDYAVNGFGAWDLALHGYGGGWSTAVPDNYTNDGNSRLDLAVKDNDSGDWYIDNASNGYTGWDPPSPIDNVDRPQVQDSSAPYITDTTIYDANGSVVSQTNGRYNLTIGIRYTVAVSINPGNGLYQEVYTEINTALSPLSYIVVENQPPSTYTAFPAATHRWFSLTCSNVGAGMLGFEMHDAQTNVVFNRDYGIVVDCNSPTSHPIGLYGIVTARGCSQGTCGTGNNGVCPSQPTSDGHYVAGCPLAGATVSVPGIGSTSTGADGSWSLPSAVGGTFSVTVSCGASCSSHSGKTCVGVTGPRSNAQVININVPAGTGAEIDTPLDEQFFAPSSGITYTTYVDYSRGRTLLHTVSVDTSTNAVRALRNPSFQKLVVLGRSGPVPVVMNGNFFDEGYPNHPDHSGNPVGYYYSGGSDLGCQGYSSLGTCSSSGASCYVDSEDVYFGTGGAPFGSVPGECGSGELCGTNLAAEVLAPTEVLPMLTIKGMTSGTQAVDIVESDGQFWSSPEFTLTGSPTCPIYDLDHDGHSDVDYAVQAAGSPFLVEGGTIVTPYVPNDTAWARTAIGVSGNTVYYVVADGEGVNGGHGATFYELGQFFSQTLHVTSAMKLDGGWSSELVLHGTLFGGERRVNTITGEDPSADMNPFTDPRGDQCFGNEANYFSAGL